MLKPFVGGNNFYGTGLKVKLLSMETNAERAQYVLMERLNPSANASIFLKDSKPIVVEAAISEFGFYGVWLRCVLQTLETTVVCVHGIVCDCARDDCILELPI